MPGAVPRPLRRRGSGCWEPSPALKNWPAWRPRRGEALADHHPENEHARLYERKRLDIGDEDPQELEIPSHDRPGAHLELEQLVEALPPAYREPLVLQVLGGYECREIAGMLGTTEGAVMTRLTRARQALRAHLETSDRARRSI